MVDLIVPQNEVPEVHQTLQLLVPEIIRKRFTMFNNEKITNKFKIFEK